MKFLIKQTYEIRNFGIFLLLFLLLLSLFLPFLRITTINTIKIRASTTTATVRPITSTVVPPLLSKIKQENVKIIQSLTNMKGTKLNDTEHFLSWYAFFSIYVVLSLSLSLSLSLKPKSITNVPICLYTL